MLAQDNWAQEPYEACRKDLLKETCRARGIRIGGSVDFLISRLRSQDQALMVPWNFSLQENIEPANGAMEVMEHKENINPVEENMKETQEPQRISESQRIRCWGEVNNLFDHGVMKENINPVEGIMKETQQTQPPVLPLATRCWGEVHKGLEAYGIMNENINYVEEIMEETQEPQANQELEEEPPVTKAKFSQLSSDQRKKRIRRWGEVNEGLEFYEIDLGNLPCVVVLESVLEAIESHNVRPTHINFMFAEENGHGPECKRGRCACLKLKYHED